MRAALAGLPGAEPAEVDLRTGAATVAAGISPRLALDAVRERVSLAWARGRLARVPFLGRRMS